MKLLRFMSIAELEKFRAGELLENTTDFHVEHGQRTDAVGFCFLDYDEYDEQEALHFLSGIVNQQICAVFEISAANVKKYMKKGEGTFAAPMTSFTEFFSSMQVTEYSTQRYHNKAMKLLKYADNFENNYKEETFDRIFEWKSPDAPVKRKINVVDKNPRQRPPKPDTPEQHLLDAVELFIRSNTNIQIPEDFFDEFHLISSPVMNLDRAITGDRLSIEGLEFAKPGGIRL